MNTTVLRGFADNAATITDRDVIFDAAAEIDRLRTEVDRLTAERDGGRKRMASLESGRDAARAEREHYRQEAERLAAELATMRESARWVPVGERLPEVGVLVLTYSAAEDDDDTYCERMVVGHSGGWYLAGGVRVDETMWTPTHWHPLPTPPEAKDGAGCTGHGTCHGALAWCDVCGDVRHVCDEWDCDQHPHTRGAEAP